MAVNKHYRGKGIARSIITDLIENTESHKISVLNIDDESKCTGEAYLWRSKIKRST